MENSRIITRPEEISRYTAFDKVINARFTRRNGEVFTIRSDYDAVFDKESRKISFEKCKQKPTMHIKYTQASNNTTVNIELSITNFNFFLDANSSGYTLSSSSNPIEWIKIQVGYFHQFPDFVNKSTPGGLTYDDYINLSQTETGLGGAKEMNVKVLATYPIKLPPDSITLFSCSVGEVFAENLVIEDQDIPPERVKYEVKSEYELTKDFTFSEKVFYWMVTRRFLRNTTNIQDISNVYESNNLLSAERAEENGIRCILTEAMKNKELPKLYDEEGNVLEVGSSTYLTHKPTVIQALNNIKANLYPKMRYGQLSTGDIFVWLDGEDPIVPEGATLFGITREEGITKIPAVTSITYSPVITITCPFFPQLDTFREFSFKSSYVASNISGYFYRDDLQNSDLFSIIVPTDISVDFSTNEDKNSCVLSGIKGT